MADTKKPFYCTLCSKGYSRVNEYDAHLSSYDHSHKKRLADMKAMQRPNPTLRRERERKAEEKLGGGLITIKPIGASGGGAGEGGKMKKGGFKSAFGSLDGDTAGGAGTAPGTGGGFKKVFVSLEGKGVGGGVGEGVWESDTDEDEERYDPAVPTTP
ncbi:hypothetical protein BDZ91DRAFT_31770 [Kalaharituber pfeilii]|nr:hypothetical protein BDZ91DRAFT_31770 [Kalaharituber pfeilii]